MQKKLDDDRNSFISSKRQIQCLLGFDNFILVIGVQIIDYFKLESVNDQG